MWYFALDCMELLYIFLLHGGYENVYFFSYILRGWGLDCWWGNDSLCILQKCIKITEDWWNCCTFIDFYNCELSVQWLYSVHIYELIINGILYNLNEKINQKYTVSFLLSIHLVIWLSYKMHIREANPTKVEKCLWSAKWARMPVYENYVSNEK